MAVIRTNPIGEAVARPAADINLTPLTIPAIGDLTAFGGNQARDLQVAGAYLDKASDSLGNIALRMQAEDNETKAREIDTEFNTALRGVLYDPQNGYYAKRGKDAYDSTVPTLKAIDELRGEYLGRAGNNKQMQAMLGRVLQARIDGVSDGIARHSSVQRLAWIDSAQKAVIDDAKEAGATYFNEDKLRDQEYFRGRNSLMEDAQAKGEPPEVVTRRLKDYDSEFNSRVVRRYISTDDPVGAQRYYQANITKFQGDDNIKLEREIKDAVENRRAQQISRIAVATGGVSADYNARVVRAEGGTPTVENSIGALGKYQFIPQTYTGLAQQTEWGKGKSQAEVRQMLLSPDGGEAKQDELKRMYDDNSVRALQSANVPVNDLTLYTTHFLGVGAGPALLKLPDNTPLKQGLVQAHGGDEGFTAKVYAANPFLAKVDTVGDLKALLAQRIGAPLDLSRSGTPQKPNLDAMLANGIALAGGDLDLQDKVSARIKSEYATRYALYQQQIATVERAAFGHIDAGGGMENLPPEIRGALDSDGLAKVRQYEDKVLEKRKKDNAETAAKGLTDLEVAGQLTTEDVKKAQPYLPASEYRNWQKIASGEDRMDDSATYERIQRGIGIRDMRDDIFSAFNAGDLSKGTRAALLAKNDDFLKQNAPATPYKVNHDRITRSLDPGLMGTGISREIYGRAVKEFDQYVAANPGREGETPEQFSKRISDFAEDTIKRHQIINTQEMAVSKPVPVNTPFNRGEMTSLPKSEATKRIIGAYGELSRKFEAGQITEDQFNRDAIALEDWRNFVQSRPETPAPKK
jgi:hypothetical protein